MLLRCWGQPEGIAGRLAQYGRKWPLPGQIRPLPARVGQTQPVLADNYEET